MTERSEGMPSARAPASRPGGHDLVRPFVMTGGRTPAARSPLRLETVVSAVAGAPSPPTDPEPAAILAAVRRSPCSLAELGAELGLVVGVVSVLVADLVAAGAVEVHHTDPLDLELSALTRIIDKVRSL